MTNNTIKKIVTSLAVTAALTSTLGAQEVKQKSIGFGVSNSEVMSDTGLSYNFSFNTKITTNKNIVWGGGFFGEQGDIDGIEMFGAGAEVIIGYQFTSKLSSYGIMGAKQQTLNESIDSIGIGYGVGAQYDIFKNFAVEARYVNYSMSIDPIGEYDNPNLTLNLKLIWE